MSDLCSKYSSNTGTEKRKNGRTYIVNTNNLSGSFSGSLNIGGDSSKKIASMCDKFAREYFDEMESTIMNNDPKKLRRFCRKYISKKTCETIPFPTDLMKYIESLGYKSDKQEL